jgi:two-component system C4-dicarboxylate transport sensor histidine kinase DctB
MGTLIVAGVLVVSRIAEQKLVGDLEQRLGNRLDVHVSGLLGDLADYPAALTMLASDPRVLRAVLSGGEDEIGAARARLRQYADLSGADSVLIVDAESRLLVDQESDSANAAAIIDWLARQPAFRMALNSGLGRAFGLVGGDGERRYVFARRIANPGKTPALLVITLNLESTELLWRLAGQDILVVDEGGVVVLSADQRRSLEPLGDVPGGAAGDSLACREAAIQDPSDQVCVARDIARLGWQMYLLGDLAPVRRQVRLLQWLTALGLISMALLIAAISQRRLSTQRTLRIKEDANRLLQQRVALRTSELESVNRQLQIEIDERIAKEEALREAQAELVQTSKLAALGQLSAGIAHQLNQPLAALRAYADNARTFIARGRIDSANDNLTLIGDLTDRIGKITKDLKVIARRQPTKTESVSLPPLVRSVIDQIEKARTADSVEIVYDGREAMMLAEPVGLQQVLANLIQNGIDAMEVTESGRAKVLSVTTEIDDDRVRLLVADCGTGISSSDMDRVFDPFFTTKEVGKGLGLGLSLSASMIQDMGGRLTASNREGGGACFTIELDDASERPAA